MIQYGILYTSSRLVGTSVEDSADKKKEKRTFEFHSGTVQIWAFKISQIVWTIWNSQLAAIFNFHWF